ncbi:MAG: hypothetical protein SNJ61_01880 [Fimbriimonadaceae bacterium]
MPTPSCALLVAVSSIALLTGCRAGPEASDVRDRGGVSSAPNAAPDPWVLATEDPRAETPALLWNGLIGIRVGRSGTSIDNAGQVLPFFKIDEYEVSGEEKIVPLPGPLQIEARVGDTLLRAPDGTDYRQELDMRTGILVSRWKQRAGSSDLSVRVETAVHPSDYQVGIRWEVSGASPQTVRFVSRFPAFSNETSVEGRFGPYDTWAKGRRVRTTEGDREILEYSVRFNRSDALLVRAVARGQTLAFKPNVDAPADPDTVESIFAASREAWARRWQTDIEIDGPVEDQQAVRSFLFYLRSSVHPEGEMAVSPMGLASETYFGHVFWDADVWVFPALALIDPTAARTIPDYRLTLMPQARRNFRQWLDDDRPVGNGNLGPPADEVWAASGIMKAWESSVSGRETVPGPSRFQHHITGTVAFALDKAAALGLADPEKAATAVREAEVFFRARATESSEGASELSIDGTMSPDEFYTGNNDLYTNLLAQWAVNGGTWVRPEGAPVFRLPRSGDALLTYDGDDDRRRYKQAAAVLAIYPLQAPVAEAQAADMMRRFSERITPNGPAMSDSVHGLIYARLGDTERAYEFWRKSWQEFTGHPLLIFSEKRRRAETYFTTGAGGSLQTVLYGFLGFRLDYEKREDAAWTMPVRNGRWLSANPKLPPQWNRVTLKNFEVLGRRFTLTATPDAVRVSPGD